MGSDMYPFQPKDTVGWILWFALLGGWMAVVIAGINVIVKCRDLQKSLRKK
jgi:hypothetical protein